jgi:hypothetical protein
MFEEELRRELYSMVNNFQYRVNAILKEKSDEIPLTSDPMNYIEDMNKVYKKEVENNNKGICDLYHEYFLANTLLNKIDSIPRGEQIDDVVYDYYLEVLDSTRYMLPEGHQLKKVNVNIRKKFSESIKKYVSVSPITAE